MTDDLLGGLRSGTLGHSTADAERHVEAARNAAAAEPLGSDPYWQDGAWASADTKAVWREVMGPRLERESDAAASPVRRSEFL